jgi:hypothetical protein
MIEVNNSLLKKALKNLSTTHAIVATVLFLLALAISFLSPVGVAKWYHVFFKLMMFMCFVMSMMFSVVSLIKGVFLIIYKDKRFDIKITIAGMIVSIVIIMSIVMSLYSDPTLIDVFGLTRKVDMSNPEMMQQW